MQERRRPGHAWQATLALLLALGHASPAAGMTGKDRLLGHWLTENGRAIIELISCGEEICGRLSWLRQPFDMDGGPKRDRYNPEPGKRSRPICGLELIEGLSPAGDATWQGGEIYNTKDGRTYGLEVEQLTRDRLKVRGFIGISLFGSSQTWTRQPDARSGCRARSPMGMDR